MANIVYDYLFLRHALNEGIPYRAVTVLSPVSDSDDAATIFVIPHFLCEYYGIV
ncbi:MAG: hypothetical protein ACTS78_03245 [Arsenophonus sp. NC-WZS1-MAG3]